MDTVTPASGVSSELDTTVRPMKDVVGPCIERAAEADWVTGIPFTVAAAEMVRVEVERD
jgi:hypothetical protein